MRRFGEFLTRHHPDDRGVVAVLAAIAMAVLIGFVGFAVDVGMVYNERRQEQSAVDAAALSGAREFLLSDDESDIATDEEVLNEVVRLSHENMVNPPPLDEWRAQFFECEDTGRLARDFTIPLTVDGEAVDCVSVRTDGRALRVRLPDTELNTYFASVLGFDSWTVSATAEAGLTRQPGNPNIIPYALGAIGDGSGLVCLRTPPPGQAQEDCEAGPTSGNFGYLAIPRPSLQIAGNCDNAGHWRVLKQNMAQGIDHELSERAGTSPENFDDPKIEDTCSEIVAGNKPNHLFSEPGIGNEDRILTEGFITGGPEVFDDGRPARLKRFPDDDPDWNRRCIQGSEISCSGGDIIDSKALWEFFDPELDYGTDVPANCHPDVIRAAGDMRAALDACLQDYFDGEYDVALITDEILESPRFTWLPEAWQQLDGEDDDWGGSSSYDIRRFRPVFIQTLYFTHGSNNWWAIDPGLDAEGNAVPIRPNGEEPDGNAKLRGLSAMALQMDLLPQEIQDEGPTAGNFESRIALVR